MTDSTTPQIPVGTENTETERTKKLFASINSELDTKSREAIKPEILSEEVIKKEEAPKEDWLEKEDKIVEQASKEVNTEKLFPKETNKTNGETNEVKNVISEAKTETNPTQTIVPNKEISSLQKDMQIIQNIEKTQVENIPVEPKIPTTQIPTGNVFNLDNLNFEIPVPAMGGTIVDNTKKTQIPENPYDNLQKIIPQIVPTINKIGNNQTKNIGIGVILILLLLGRFVIKTMYPIQYNETINSVMGTEDEDSVVIEDSPPLTGDLNESGNNILPEIESGNILLDSGNSLLDSGILESLTGEQIDTGLNHNAATIETENEINTNQANNEGIDSFKVKLETFVSQGKDTLEEGKKANNKEMIKYSTALYKKGETYLQNLANGDEISTDEMTNILSELGSYLTKISPNTNVGISNPEETETTGGSLSQTETTQSSEERNNTNTSGGEFNPDAFFGNK